MAYLLSVLALATVLFAFSPAGMFAIYGPALLLIDLLSLILKVVRCGFARRRPVDWLDSKMRLAIEGLGPELGDEWRAALVWLHRARVLWGCPIHAAVCLLGLALLGTCLLPLGPELGDEWRAALVWLHRARVLWGCPIHAAVCLLGLALLGTCLLPLLHGVPWDAALARAIACGGAFTAVNVAYLVAIEACRWRMHVHVKRARAA